MISLREDLNRNLDEVERAWIRIPATIGLSIPVIIICIILGAWSGFMDAMNLFILPCIKGKPHD